MWTLGATNQRPANAAAQEDDSRGCGVRRMQLCCFWRGLTLLRVAQQPWNGQLCVPRENSWPSQAFRRQGSAGGGSDGRAPL